MSSDLTGEEQVQVCLDSGKIVRENYDDDEEEENRERKWRAC